MEFSAKTVLTVDDVHVDASRVGQAGGLARVVARVGGLGVADVQLGGKRVRPGHRDAQPRLGVQGVGVHIGGHLVGEQHVVAEPLHRPQVVRALAQHAGQRHRGARLDVQVRRAQDLRLPLCRGTAGNYVKNTKTNDAQPIRRLSMFASTVRLEGHKSDVDVLRTLD